MEFDLMVGSSTWEQAASLARSAESVGFSGLVCIETSQAPWMSLAAAGMATSRLMLSTGVAVAFARSPMVTAASAWELAGNTQGRFRLGLGSQVKAHIERRYGAAFAPPGPRLRDYVEAVRACFAAFAGDRPLDHRGPYYELTLLPPAWLPRPHPYGDIKIDISAVNPWMCRMAAAVADGIHVHPFHSPTYLRHHLLPAVAEGAAAAGRSPAQVELTIPVFAVPGDTPEERAPLLEEARAQIAFYGSTRNYAFQFDDLGFTDTSALLNERLKAGDVDGLVATITDEMLAHFAVIAPWDELAGALLDRYQGIATRLVMYLAQSSIEADPATLGRWGEISRFVTAA